MPLPGKLCIGILEEDNPQKSYFRFKPLLIEENGRYIPFNEPDAYPEDGCIRIVPDKNESSHFKARMRRMGLFAVVDLRDHPHENDKIRQNKNHRGDDLERNAFIIYSDVVREPASGMIFSLLPLRPEDAESTPLTDPPATPRVLLRPEDVPLADIWRLESDEIAGWQLRSDAAQVSVDALQVFDLPGFRASTLSFAILPPTAIDHVIELPAPKPAKPAAPEARKEPEPVRSAPESAQPVVEPSKPLPESTDSSPKASAPDEDKPWISHDSALSGRAVDPALPPHQRALAAQSGFNPRRGRSLQEIVDEKWRHSRIDQLGHPAPSLSTAAPVPNPVERAVSTVREVWIDPALRAELIDAFVRLEGLDSAMDARRAAVRENAVNQQLTELEAQRLEILADLERLKLNGADVREQLKREIRKDEAAALADAVQKTREAQAERARWETEAAQAKTAAECAQDALNALVDGRFEQRLHEFAINSRAVALLKAMDTGAVVSAACKGEGADADELIRRVMECFADVGQPMDRSQAINLLICAAQGSILFFSGAPGTGKTSAVRLLARALGVESVRYAEYAPGSAPLTPDLPNGDVPAIVLLDDVNLAPGADLTRGLTPAAERGELLLCATLQDDGSPVATHLFGRAFTLRMDDGGELEPKPTSAPKVYAPVTRESLKRAFAPALDVLPEAQLRRLEKLRDDLALAGVQLPKKTLTALWRYCAAAIPMLGLEPSAVLDLAVAQRVIPSVLAGAPLAALAALPKLLEDLPRSKALLNQPLPIQL